MPKIICSPPTLIFFFFEITRSPPPLPLFSSLRSPATISLRPSKPPPSPRQASVCR
uniref:Uncharacterized protein n=1 Tax=Cucumis melo TaxID=3656 RepID=A0A9I9EMH4_CUCME